MNVFGWALKYDISLLCSFGNPHSSYVLYKSFVMSCVQISCDRMARHQEEMADCLHFDQVCFICVISTELISMSDVSPESETSLIITWIVTSCVTVALHQHH